MTLPRRIRLVTVLASVWCVGGLAALAQPVAPAAGGGQVAGEGGEGGVETAGVWADRVWTTAEAGDADGALALLDMLPVGHELPEVGRLRASIDLYKANLAKREEARNKRIAEVSKELDEHLAATDDPGSLLEALRSAVELYMLTPDKDALMGTRRMAQLVAETETAARRAEAEGRWLDSSELFVRLNALREDEQTYKPDVKRQYDRLGMIGLYAPEQIWKMRNDRRLQDGEDPLPPYNDFGDDFKVKLAGIEEGVVTKAISMAAARHVERVGPRRMLTGGLSALKMLAMTSDLDGVFPGLADTDARDQFVRSLDEETKNLADPDRHVRMSDTYDVLRGVRKVNGQTVALPDEVLLHEFGNGALTSTAELGDDYTTIIWPDEMDRFKRIEGNFVGVGIQIQLDELFYVKVVTPLEGTPAQRAGILTDDRIVKVDGKSIVGFTLNQAVDVITGREGTHVVLSVSREDKDGQTKEIDFDIVRARIPLRTVKGWKRLGEGENRWDWFIDHEHGIGYVRLTGFYATTSHEFDDAIRQMKADGLKGLVLDMRFNPGGMLDQAVAVANRFIPSGVIVSTQNASGRTQQRERAIPGRDWLHDIPVVVLVNEGSASGTEILSGAIQDYAHDGEISAIILGQRTFGKAMVQNIWELDHGRAAVKITTQYYRLPGGRLIQRRPGRHDWGVEPDVTVEMLPDQIGDALSVRQRADVLPLDANGQLMPDAEAPPDPADLIVDGTDLQLEAALVLLEAKSLGHTAMHAMLN